MAKKEFAYYGKSIEELRTMDLSDFIKIVPSRQRRSLSRGLRESQKRLLVKIRKAKKGVWKKPIKTHCRDMIVVPEMLDLTIHVHRGKGFEAIKILPEMLGLYLGELTLTRNKVKHSAPGIGATKSSASASVK